MWNTLLKCYWQVAVFKESPANTPYSLLLLVISSFCYFILTLFQWETAELPKQFSFNFIILLCLGLLFVYFAYTFLILQIAGKINRAVQTLTTLFATHFIIHAIAFPLIVLAPQLVGLDSESNVNASLALGYVFITLSLTIWQFLITAFIYRQALELDFFSSLFVSFGLSICNILILLML